MIVLFLSIAYLFQAIELPIITNQISYLKKLKLELNKKWVASFLKVFFLKRRWRTR